MSGGIIYYTDNRLDEPIFSICQRHILEAGLSIVSVSLKPINFGQNIVLDLKPGIITMFRQILTALEASKADVIFFTEHDILYHPLHFDFIPPGDDTFYYNTNVWRWDYPKDRAITYDNLRSLSGLCCNRKLAIEHYKKRLELIDKKGWKEDSHEPGWVRKMGYEPGKNRKRGGFSDDKVEHWRSEFPNIDIRHSGTVSPPKVTLDSFKHLPKDWRETTIDKIPGWNLRELFHFKPKPEC